MKPDKKRTLFITGTDTGAGKTVLTALLAGFFRESGVRVAALKPVCSGGRQDARILHAALSGALTLDQINPWHFRAAIAPSLAARKEKKRVTLAQVVAHIQLAGRDFDAILVEGAGGLLSPLGAGFNSRDLLIALGAMPVLVAFNRLGVVNHVLLTLEALPEPFRARTRLVLMTPATPDASTASNAGLLKQLTGHEVCRLPWLGSEFFPGAGPQPADMRRILADFL